MSWVKQLLSDTPKRRIMVIGDVMLDRYLYGSIERISPEAPVPIVHLDRAFNRLGGAANVAANLVRMGAHVDLIAVTGEDAYDSTFRELCTVEGIGHDGIVSSKTRRTTAKTRILAGGQQVLRVDDEDSVSIEPELQQELLQVIMSHTNTSPPDAVILQDYNKGLLTSELIAGIMSVMAERKIPVAVDPKRDNFLAYSGATIFKPNLREIDAQLPYTVTADLESLNRASADIRASLGHKISCITLSEHGIYLDDGERSAIYPVDTREIIDVCGAGDAVISIIVLSMLAGLSLDQMAVAGNVAGGMVCSHVGVTPIERSMFMSI